MANSVTTVPAQSHPNAILKAHIQAAVSRPDAKGMKGFLLWVEAAWPKRIADPIIKAAQAALAKQAANVAATGALGAYMRPLGALAPASPLSVTWGGPNTFGSFGSLGWVPPAVQARINRLKATNVAGFGGFGALGQTSTTATVAATPAASATPSWMSDITSAISAVGQAYLTKTQVSDAQTLFNTNLQRAQMGLSPLPTNPADYGLPSPTLNFGLASGTTSLVMWGAIGLGVLGIGYLAIKATKG